MIRITSEDDKSKTFEFIVEGKITRRELLNIYSEIERKAKSWGEVNFIEHFNGIDGIEANAIWEDFKLYFKNRKYFRKAALITNKNWVSLLTRIFSPLFRVDIKIFATNEISAARLWILA